VLLLLFITLVAKILRLEANVKNGKWWKGCKLPSCLINAQPLLAHHPAADDILAAQGHDLTDDWSLSSAHFVDS